MIFRPSSSSTLQDAVTKLAALTVAVLVFATASGAQAQKSFGCAEEAADALVKAAGNQDPKIILTVLGPEGADIVSSGDAVADAETRQHFVSAYEAKHQIVREGEDKAFLTVGPDDFPFPIPIVRKSKGWQFDVSAGREEILSRRIGRNELSAIQTCLAYVDAQNEYAEKGYVGNGVYAQRIVSRPGRKDGLYWPSGPDEESPLGELAARAAARGYSAGQERAPYHGYYFKILTRQGPSAPGGAMDYRVHGRMIGGFALVAYPAQYGNSGVMTFLVNHHGTVYQKDLGRRSAAIASAMTTFNPDKSWERVDAATQSSAGQQ